jgi:hypothetical protein
MTAFQLRLTGRETYNFFQSISSCRLPTATFDQSRLLIHVSKGKENETFHLVFPFFFGPPFFIIE